MPPAHMVYRTLGRERIALGDTAQFDRAAALLPERLQGEALFLETPLRERAEEIRLYCGRGARIILDEGSVSLRGSVDRDDLELVLERASRSSLHSVLNSLRQGFLTAPGGFRIGVCGTAAVKDGDVLSFQQLSSLCIRIPRQEHCVPPELAHRLWDRSLLVLSPPGGGKTTFLRDLVRLVSDAGRRICLVDERSELAALEGGVPRFDVGRNTDILEGCPKAAAVEMLLRSMAPQVIAMDELGPGERETVLRAAGSGVTLWASVHCASPQELNGNALPPNVFRTGILIQREGGKRMYREVELP